MESVPRTLAALVLETVAGRPGPAERADDRVLFEDILATVVGNGQRRGEVGGRYDAVELAAVLAAVTMDALQRWAFGAYPADGLADASQSRFAVVLDWHPRLAVPSRRCGVPALASVPAPAASRSRAATAPMTIVAGDSTGVAPRAASVVRDHLLVGTGPPRTAITGVSGARPPAMSRAAMSPRWATPMSTTMVPPDAGQRLPVGLRLARRGGDGR